MKNTLFLFISLALIISLTACSNDDDRSSVDNNILQDSIIGVWKPIKGIEIHPDGTETIENFDNCFKQSRYYFNRDNSYNQLKYTLNTTCVINNNIELTNGTWEKIDEEAYRIIFDFEYSDTGETNTSISHRLYNFPNINTLRLGYYFGHAGNGEIEYVFTEYSRVE